MENIRKFNFQFSQFAEFHWESLFAQSNWFRIRFTPFVAALVPRATLPSRISIPDLFKNETNIAIDAYHSWNNVLSIYTKAMFNQVPDSSTRRASLCVNAYFETEIYRIGVNRAETFYMRWIIVCMSPLTIPLRLHMPWHASCEYIKMIKTDYRMYFHIGW